jgi:cyanate permease
LDTFTEWIFKAGALAKLLTGFPYLLALFADGSRGFLDGRVHEYGTTLLVLAGIFNLLAVSTALEQRKAER